MLNTVNLCLLSILQSQIYEKCSDITAITRTKSNSQLIGILVPRPQIYLLPGRPSRPSQAPVATLTESPPASFGLLSREQSNCVQSGIYGDAVPRKARVGLRPGLLLSGQQ